MSATYLAFKHRCRKLQVRHLYTESVEKHPAFDDYLLDLDKFEHDNDPLKTISPPPTLQTRKTEYAGDPVYLRPSLPAGRPSFVGPTYPPHAPIRRQFFSHRSESEVTKAKKKEIYEKQDQYWRKDRVTREERLAKLAEMDAFMKMMFAQDAAKQGLVEGNDIYRTPAGMIQEMPKGMSSVDAVAVKALFDDDGEGEEVETEVDPSTYDLTSPSEDDLLAAAELQSIIKAPAVAEASAVIMSPATDAPAIIMEVKVNLTIEPGNDKAIAYPPDLSPQGIENILNTPATDAIDVPSAADAPPSISKDDIEIHPVSPPNTGGLLSQRPSSAVPGTHSTSKEFESEADKRLETYNCVGCGTTLLDVSSYICSFPGCCRRFCRRCAWLLVKYPTEGGVDGDLDALAHHWKVERGEAKIEDAPVVRVFKRMPATGAAWLLKRLEKSRSSDAAVQDVWGKQDYDSLLGKTHSLIGQYNFNNVGPQHDL